MKKWMVWMFLIAAIAGFNALALKFVGPPSHILASLGYYDCISQAGECGKSIPGKGYPCKEPGRGCGQGDHEDLHCVTKVNWFWGCICECDC